MAELSVTFADKPNDPWFVAADVCKARGLGQVTNAIRPFDDKDLRLITRGHSDYLNLFKGVRAPSYKLISEAGLYSLVMRSDKPEAKTFQDWVTRDVFPVIRKADSYVKGEEHFDLSSDTGPAEATATVMARRFCRHAKSLIASLVAISSPMAAKAASSCWVVGDSIAVGIAPYFKECSKRAKVGISSTRVLKWTPHANVLIISAGSNDPRSSTLQSNLQAIQKKAYDRVIWVAPVHPRASGVVRAVAGKKGEAVVSFTPGRDNVHPKSYRQLAGAIRKELNGVLKPE